MIVNSTSIFFTLLFTFIFSIIFTNSFDLFDEIYGHGISRDESLPFDVSGKQIAIEGILKPPFFNEANQNPTFTLRAHDEKNNETIKDINYRVIAKLKNETILDQRFHAIDGVVSANLTPSNNSLVHEIILPKNQEEEELQGQQNISKNDLVQVSLEDPITIKSKMLSDGGLYTISVILEKTSKGIKLESDKKIDLFISIAKDFPFVIKEESFNNTSKINNNLTLVVRTYYDEIVYFMYDQESSKISFKMPFTWDLDYVNQVVFIHQELLIPKSHIPLSNASEFTGALNGNKLPENAVFIDDYTDSNKRSVHFVVSNVKLNEVTKQIIKAGINPYAEFELQPRLN